jgi:hypothetical protein
MLKSINKQRLSRAQIARKIHSCDQLKRHFKKRTQIAVKFTDIASVEYLVWTHARTQMFYVVCTLNEQKRPRQQFPGTHTLKYKHWHVPVCWLSTMFYLWQLYLTHTHVQHNYDMFKVQRVFSSHDWLHKTTLTMQRTQNVMSFCIFSPMVLLANGLWTHKHETSGVIIR